jgi:quinol monooxygenase YgiN
LSSSRNGPSLDALKAHAAAPHMTAYAAKMKDLIASRVIHVLTPA